MSNTGTVEQLLRDGGRTYSEQAGISLRDKPSPLYQLLLLSILLAKPISADIAADAMRELRRIGIRTPQGTLRTTWQQRVDALGRAHYRRYDESTATRLEQAAIFVRDRWHGDLRRLGQEADHEPRTAAELLTETPGIGSAGADIFLREVQRVWPWLCPYLDQRVCDGARVVGLPHSRQRLTRLFEGKDAAALGAALVRATIDGPPTAD